MIKLIQLAALFLITTTVNASTRYFEEWTSDYSNQNLVLSPTGTGVVRVSGEISAETAKVQNLTQGGVVFADSAKALTDSPAEFFWDNTNKRLGIGTGAEENTVTISGTSQGSALSVHADDGADLAEVSVHRHSSAAAQGSHILGVRSRGSEATETVVQSGDTLLRLNAMGHDGTDYEPASAIEFKSDGTPGNNDMPGSILFRTTADGTRTLTTHATLSNNGLFNITSALAVDSVSIEDSTGTATGSNNLTVTTSGSGELIFSKAGTFQSALDIDGILSPGNDIVITDTTPAIYSSVSTRCTTVNGGGALGTAEGAQITLCGSGNGSTPDDLTLGAGSTAGDIAFKVGSTTHGTVANNGTWTIGESGGTDNHVINGNLNGSGSGYFAGQLSVGGNFIGSGSGQFSGKISILSQNGIELQDLTGGQNVLIKPSAETSSYTITLPPAQGSDRQILVNDGTGALEWENQSGGGVNLLTNFSFEDGLGFTCNHASQSCAQSTAEVYHGTYSALIDASGSSTYDAEYCVTNTSLENMNGQVSCMVWTDSSVFNFCSSDDSTSCITSQDIAADSAWKRYTSTMVVPSSGKLCVRITSDSGTTSDIYVDACEFTEFKPDTAPTTSAFAEYTPTVSGISAISSDLRYKIVGGDSVQIQGWVSGTVAGSELQIGLPNSWTVSSTYDSSTTTVVGEATRSHTTLNETKTLVVLATAADSFLNFGVREYAVAAYPDSTVNGNAYLSNGQKLFINATVKVNELSGTTPTQIAAAAFPASRIKFYNDTNCQPLTTSASFATLNDTDCDYATASKIGSTATPTVSGDISLKIPTLPPGKYKAYMSGYLRSSASAGNLCVWRLSDGTNVIGPVSQLTDSGTYEISLSAIEGVIEITSPQTDYELKLQALRLSGAGACGANAQTANYSIEIGLVPISGVMSATLKEVTKTPAASLGFTPVLVSATVTDGAGTTTVSRDDSDFISGNCTNGSTGNYTCTFTSSYWYQQPHCWVQPINGAVLGEWDTNGTTGGNVLSFALVSHAAVDTSFYLFCHGFKN